MVSKSERFELRLDQNFIDKIDAWRREQNEIPSRSEAVRRLIEKGLSNDVVLSPGDRLVTTMLCDIYKHLNVSGDLDTNFIKDAVSDGHFWALEREYHSLIQASPVDNAIATEAITILNMWYVLKMTYERMSDSDKEYVAKSIPFFKSPIFFPGFDGNNESKHYSVACFFIRKMGYFKELDDNTDLNSHGPSLQSYRNMLAVFNSIQRDLLGTPFTNAQFIEIFLARFPKQDE